MKRKASGDATSSRPKRTRTVSPVLDSSVHHKESNSDPLITPIPADPPIKGAAVDEIEGQIDFRVVSSNNSRENRRIIAGLMGIYQTHLPLLPKSHISRLVYGQNYISIAIVKPPFEVLGGVTYRPFNTKGFAEIVFCTISSDRRVRGYGARLIAHLKDYVKTTSPIMQLLMYADNYAIGYFEKQGFTKEITVDKSIWMGYIQEYEGGTIMQCSMTPEIRYLEGSQA